MYFASPSNQIKSKYDVAHVFCWPLKVNFYPHYSCTKMQELPVWNQVAPSITSLVRTYVLAPERTESSTSVQVVSIHKSNITWVSKTNFQIQCHLSK